MTLRQRRSDKYAQGTPVVFLDGTARRCKRASTFSLPYGFVTQTYFNPVELAGQPVRSGGPPQVVQELTTAIHGGATMSASSWSALTVGDSTAGGEIDHSLRRRRAPQSTLKFAVKPVATRLAMTLTPSSLRALSERLGPTALTSGFAADASVGPQHVSYSNPQLVF
jgi:hypothetical protein